MCGSEVCVPIQMNKHQFTQFAKTASGNKVEKHHGWRQSKINRGKGALAITDLKKNRAAGIHSTTLPIQNTKRKPSISLLSFTDSPVLL